MLKNKRGAELTLNTIVIAALVVLVLAVVTIIFMAQFGQFASSVGECVRRGGEIMTEEECEEEDGIFLMHIDEDETDDDKVCCSV